MKRSPTLLACISLACVVFAGSALAGPFDIDWFTISPSAGNSTGGSYSLTSTVGQPGAALLAEGNYSVQGGFWSIIQAVQTPGAPMLSISAVNATLNLCWPVPADGFILEQTASLASGVALWKAVAANPRTNNAVITVTVQVAPGNTFYRLRKP